MSEDIEHKVARLQAPGVQQKATATRMRKAAESAEYRERAWGGLVIGQKMQHDMEPMRASGVQARSGATKRERAKASDEYRQKAFGGLALGFTPEARLKAVNSRFEHHPETRMNSEDHPMAKSYLVTAPNGTHVLVSNLKGWCRLNEEMIEQSLSCEKMKPAKTSMAERAMSGLSAVCHGRGDNWYGWRCEPADSTNHEKRDLHPAD